MSSKTTDGRNYKHLRTYACKGTLVGVAQAASRQTLMALEEQSVIRLIRAFTTLPQQPQQDLHITIERAGELLWDLTADPETAAVLCRNQLQAAIMLQLQACAARLQEQSSHRILELSFGMLANMYGIHHLVLELTRDPAEFMEILDLFLVLDDAPALSEICRMLAACLSSDEVRQSMHMTAQF